MNHIIPECTVMVGVSTEQNTTNMVPFRQFRGQTMIIAETDDARTSGWTDGLKIVLKKPGQSEIVKIGRGDDLSLMMQALDEAVSRHDTVCWNFGGGQKMQQLALFSVFSQRLKNGKQDWACYADPQSHKTHIIIPQDDGNLKPWQMPTDAALSIEEIVHIFGNTLDEKNPGTLLWSRFSPDRTGFSPITEKEADWIYDYAKRQRMYKYFDLDKEAPPPGSEPVYPGKFKTIGDYFEKVVQRHVTRIMTKKPEEHTVNEIWGNVRVVNREKGGEIAEYDITLVTNFGTIIPLDPKSGIFSKKDADARRHNLLKISGRYTKFFAIFPCFADDFENDSVLYDTSEGKALLNQPFTMRNRGEAMFVFSDKGKDSFLVKKGRKGKVKLAETEDSNSVRVRTLACLLEDLNLQRPDVA